MKFRKRAVVIDAVRFETNNVGGNEHMDAILDWINGNAAWHDGTDIFIPTLDGVMRASVGDWIIKGVNGEFYPCKPDIFEKTYEPAE